MNSKWYRSYSKIGKIILTLFAGFTMVPARADAAAMRQGNSPYVVDLKQLQIQIPDAVVKQYEKGREESSKGEFKKAIGHLKKVLDMAPSLYEVHNDIGVQYLKLGEFRLATSEFETARQLNPRAAEPLVSLGALYYQVGESKETAGQIDDAALSFQEATELLQSAIRLNPRSGMAYLFLGAALFKSGAYERAEPMFHRALELDKTIEDAHLMLINVYKKQRRFNDALSELRSYLERNPNDPLRPLLDEVKKEFEQILNP